MFVIQSYNACMSSRPLLKTFVSYVYVPQIANSRIFTQVSRLETRHCEVRKPVSRLVRGIASQNTLQYHDRNADVLLSVAVKIIYISFSIFSSSYC